jgi:hypothetical protein
MDNGIAQASGAITSLTFTLSAGNFQSGSGVVATLYGVRA